jgi:uncharacterized membrane protein
MLVPKEQRDLRWSEMSGLLKGLQFGVVALIAAMATALFFGIDPDGGNRVETLFRGLLGQGQVKSELWLWVARLLVVGIVVMVIAIRREMAQTVLRRQSASDLAE